MHGNRLSGGTQITKASNSDNHVKQIASYCPEFVLLKSKRLNSINFIKVEAYEDDIKSFEQLSFLEQLNAKRDTREKALTLNDLVDEVITFLLKLSSPHAMIAKNHLILNNAKDICLYAHLLTCKECLKKVLKVPNS